MSAPIPTPEDIALAEKVTELIAESLNREHATYAQIAQPIADYCAPLRKRIEELEQANKKLRGILIPGSADQNDLLSVPSIGVAVGEMLRQEAKTAVEKARAELVACKEELAMVKRDREYLATHWAGQLETAHKVIAESATNPGRVPVLVGGKVVADSFGNILFREAPHPMVELAEIGRLAVEERRAYHDHDTRDEEYRIARERLADATVAYLAKQPKEEKQ